MKMVVCRSKTFLAVIYYITTVIFCITVNSYFVEYIPGLRCFQVNFQALLTKPARLRMASDQACLTSIAIIKEIRMLP